MSQLPNFSTLLKSVELSTLLSGVGKRMGPSKSKKNIMFSNVEQRFFMVFQYNWQMHDDA